jgi:hypothetical protein
MKKLAAHAAAGGVAVALPGLVRNVCRVVLGRLRGWKLKMREAPGEVFSDANKVKNKNTIRSSSRFHLSASGTRKWRLKSGGSSRVFNPLLGRSSKVQAPSRRPSQAFGPTWSTLRSKSGRVYGHVGRDGGLKDGNGLVVPGGPVRKGGSSPPSSPKNASVRRWGAVRWF